MSPGYNTLSFAGRRNVVNQNATCDCCKRFFRLKQSLQRHQFKEQCSMMGRHLVALREGQDTRQDLKLLFGNHWSLAGVKEEYN